ncbi:HNH endonuclease [Hydrogenophaga sp.]|uniref:HNH endonuclease n=1 Tax=Hydrogenophaga sp. TaxID=1904254 RepID=UPI002731DB9B|nr:HNH endonuclease [Hydrogenophaga sp.]MDP1686852.1 HNH endonuclease [Hydrogenophaga sp.]
MKRQLWTPDEIEALRRLYPDHTADVVGKVLGRKAGSVHAKANQLGIEKSEAFKVSDRSGRIRRGKHHPAMVASRFQPGLKPWNKGTNYVAGGRSAETRFRKGSKPHTTLPLGSYRINPDGHLQRKVAEVSGSNSKRWRNVAELVWIEANGPLPPKHIVVFKPGMRTNVLELITLDRVECISMAENARRNHPRNKHPEFARLVQIKGAITRQVNRIAREAKERA